MLRICAFLVLALAACSEPTGQGPGGAVRTSTPSTTSTTSTVATSSVAMRSVGSGYASRYADSLAGRPTATGEPYDPQALTCAHRRLRFGTVVEVVRPKSGRRVRCRVNDRGPFHERRVIDLSRAAANALGFEGVAKVELFVAEEGS